MLDQSRRRRRQPCAMLGVQTGRRRENGMGRDDDWPWEPEEFGNAHRGRAAAVLADGTEPAPVYLDLGSGTHVPSSSHWTLYTGESPRRPRAAAVRGACVCGWRGEQAYGLGQDDDADRDTVDVEAGPYRDWADHITAVEQAAAPIPDQVAAALAVLEEQLAALADGGPVAALRVAALLERLADETGRRALCAIDIGDDPDAGEHTWAAVATGLGLTETEARTRLLRWLY
ncbi:hypothetical protein ACU686_13135 [Yinghuangia aomiensis]